MAQNVLKDFLADDKEEPPSPAAPINRLISLDEAEGSASVEQLQAKLEVANSQMQILTAKMEQNGRVAEGLKEKVCADLCC
jgi:methanogenic corrinoid protein MtbC1